SGEGRESIAAAPKSCNHPRDISPQTRRREKQSREQSVQSARVLKSDYVDLRRCGRAAGVPCLAVDAVGCTIRRSELAKSRQGTAVVAEPSTLARDRRQMR